MAEEPTRHGIGSDNKGNQLLKSMGWIEGMGLGRHEDGITVPILAEGYGKGIGLGALTDLEDRGGYDRRGKGRRRGGGF